MAGGKGGGWTGLEGDGRVVWRQQYPQPTNDAVGSRRWFEALVLNYRAWRHRRTPNGAQSVLKCAAAWGGVPGLQVTDP